VTYAATVLADNPVVYLRLGESSGTTATDSSSSGLNAIYQDGFTLGAAGALVGDSDKAVSLNNGKVTFTGQDVPGQPLYLASTLTLEAWIKTTSTDASFHAIFAKSSVYAFYVHNGNLSVWDWPAGHEVSSGVSVADGNWHHVVFAAAHGVTNGSQLYVDGSPAGAAFTYTIGGNTADQFPRVGNDNSIQYFIGTVDEFAVYGTVLSPARVLAHYQAGMGIVPATGGGKFILKDVRIIVDSIDASSVAHSVSVEKSAEDIDITSYASSAYKEYLTAERVESFQVGLYVDSARAVQLALHNAQSQGSTVFVEVLPRGPVNSATNPAWAANCLVQSLTHLDAEAGDAATSEVTLQSTGDVYEYTTGPTILSPLTLLGPSTLLGP